jgi:chitin synthase
MNLLHTFQSKLSLNDPIFETPFEGMGILADENPSVNFIMAIKHLNNKKIDSHLYFFRGFCEYLNPNLCMCIDIGTAPEPQSINQLYRLMESVKNIGGACGDMGVDLNIKGTGSWLLNYAQYKEYQLSHYIDKAFEAFFSYQSVLPGAFSILRWEAIKEEPIESFLEGLH